MPQPGQGMVFLAATVSEICSPPLPSADGRVQGAALVSILLLSLPCHVQWGLPQLPPRLIASHHSASNFHFRLHLAEQSRAGS